MKNPNWRHWIGERISAMREEGMDPHAPTMARNLRDEMPFKYVEECAYRAVYDEVGRVLRRYGLRSGEGDKQLYVPPAQLELDGIVAWAKVRLAQEGSYHASTVRGIEGWKADHPECPVTVSEIIALAEQPAA